MFWKKKSSDGSTSGDSFLKDVFDGLVGGAAVAAFQGAIQSFFKTSGEKAGEDFSKFAMHKIFGINTEDERRFNEATKLMGQNWYSRLMERLGKLSASESDYYRITVMNEDPQKIFETIQFHAEMDDPTWDNYLKVMNVKLEDNKQQFTRFQVWAKTNAGKLGRKFKDFSDGVTDDLHGSGIIDTVADFGDTLKGKNTSLLNNLLGRS